mgnify:CR=1 FL=1
MSDARYSVCGSGYPLTAGQQALVDLAESLGPAFATRAERHDRTSSTLPSITARHVATSDAPGSSRHHAARGRLIGFQS